MTRRRADVVLAERGLFDSRERARAAILAGHVRVDGRVLAKAGEPIRDDAHIEVAQVARFVSRGGDKIAGALSVFDIDVRGVHALDVGASTGGFTDCLLQNGAADVVAVDVGYGQLAWKLRNDPRVRVFERTNIRSAGPDTLGGPFDLVVVDVSFISLKTVLPAILTLMAADATLLALVKPQFEAGKGRVGKKGVVRDPRIHQDVLESTLDALRAAGLRVLGLTWSPIAGPEGNIEFWVYGARAGTDAYPDVAHVVSGAHEALGA
jgi:23S rRNA (cytidine1920-2'-O)/16S rRNA (cytidine1409-2'-O)-methyltransferase